MIYRNIHLNPDSYDFVRTRIERGSYENANDLVRAALRALHREESACETTRRSGSIAEGDVFRKLWEKAAQSTQTRR